ncbi:hypothetical protein [Cellulomonas sp. KRMCY2]|uniref:hypothetical protein n=1 Tax=Cellulomonas sp. KRMCY2 TaxID=1304865 RepID=UPI0012DD20F1|nr:hypothetical protein [Cellulomonas sp. KRMCY2]
MTPRSAAPLSTAPEATDGTTTAEGLPAPSPDEVAAAAAPGTTLVQSSTTGRRMVAGSLAAALAGIVGAPALWAWSTRRRVP